MNNPVRCHCGRVLKSFYDSKKICPVGHVHSSGGEDDITSAHGRSLPDKVEKKAAPLPPAPATYVCLCPKDKGICACFVLGQEAGKLDSVVLRHLLEEQRKSASLVEQWKICARAYREELEAYVADCEADGHSPLCFCLPAVEVLATHPLPSEE